MLRIGCGFCSVAKSCRTLCNSIDCSMSGSILHYHLEFVQIYVHWVSDAIQPSHPLAPFSFCLQSFPVWVFPNELALPISWPKYWSFSFSISPSNEYSGLISFRMDSLDLLAVQGILKSFLQHHSSKASILWCSAFFIVQFSHPYMTTEKTIALTRQKQSKQRQLFMLLQHQGRGIQATLWHDFFFFFIFFYF